MNFLPELALIGFVFFGLFSPGPNVILLTTSGARFGFRATVPHIFGVAVGVGITSGVTGFGVGALLQAMPILTIGLKVIASLWILRMAFLLWHANLQRLGDRARPFTFAEAVIFQWVNPKVWAVAMAATAYVASLPRSEQAVLLATVFTTINLGVCLFWTAAGTLLSYLLANASAWRLFMRIMAIALALFSGMVFL